MDNRGDYDPCMDQNRCTRFCPILMGSVIAVVLLLVVGGFIFVKVTQFGLAKDLTPRNGWACAYFYKDGARTDHKRWKGTFRNRQRHGPWTEWWENGKRKACGYFRCDLKVGKWKYWDWEGGSMCIAFYIDDKEVTRSEYLAAYAKDPTLPKPPAKEIGKALPTPDADAKERGEEKMTEAPGDEE